MVPKVPDLPAVAGLVSGRRLSVAEAKSAPLAMGAAQSTRPDDRADITQNDLNQDHIGGNEDHDARTAAVRAINGSFHAARERYLAAQSQRECRDAVRVLLEDVNGHLGCAGAVDVLGLGPACDVCTHVARNAADVLDTSLRAQGRTLKCLSLVMRVPPEALVQHVGDLSNPYEALIELLRARSLPDVTDAAAVQAWKAGVDEHSLRFVEVCAAVEAALAETAEVAEDVPVTLGMLLRGVPRTFMREGDIVVVVYEGDKQGERGYHVVPIFPMAAESPEARVWLPRTAVLVANESLYKRPVDVVSRGPRRARRRRDSEEFNDLMRAIAGGDDLE
jgi:hypothetical protein